MEGKEKENVPSFGKQVKSYRSKESLIVPDLGLDEHGRLHVEHVSRGRCRLHWGGHSTGWVEPVKISLKYFFVAKAERREWWL